MSAEPRPEPGGRAAGPDGPWSDTCRDLTGLLRRALAGHGAADVRVEVTALGVRDELAVGRETGRDSDRETDRSDANSDVDHEADLCVRLYGGQAVLGPFRSPGAAADGRPCGRCLARRWQTVRSAPLREALELGGGTTAAGRSPYATAFAADAMAALAAAHREAAGFADKARHNAAEPASVYLLDLETLRSSRWPLVSDPECPECGRRVPDTAQAAELVLEPTPKHAPNRFRVRAAEDFGVRTEAYVNPVCGMLGAWVTPDLASRTTSATVGSFHQRSGTYLRESFWGGHTDNYEASIRVGILEGFERFAGMRPRGKRTTVFAPMSALDVPTVDPRECGVYAPEFYRRNPMVNRFDPDVPIPWVWGYSLRDRKAVLVPEILTYYHAPGGVENRFVQESSNGCAAGGGYAEAVYYGLMEVVERDAFLIAWYGRTPLPEIDPSTSASTETRALVDRLEMYGYRARFFDARVSFPIPVVVAAAQRIDGGTGALCFGAGASLDPQAALAAGLCEIATDAVNLPWRTVLAHDKLSAMARDFDRVEILHDHPLVYGLPEMGRHAAFLLDRPRADAPPPLALDTLRAEVAAAGLAPSLDLREDVEHCVAAVAGAGFDVVVVDQTIPEQRDLGAVTVSVIVPGLLPIDFGWTRQRALHLPRLRTALRDAGRAERDLEAADLNPAPHPFP